MVKCSYIFLSLIILPVQIGCKARDANTAKQKRLYDKSTLEEYEKKQFSIDDFKKVLSGKSKIYDVLSALPDDLKSRYVIVNDSQSNQGTSPDNPRIIMFNRDASFILTFNSGKRSDPGFDRIETMQFNFVDKEFELREFSFPGESTEGPAAPVSLDSQVNHSDCMTCHQNPVRPNWEIYNVWPGVSGAIGDSIVSVGASNPIFRMDPYDEQASLNKLFDQQKPGSRYLHLKRKELHLTEYAPEFDSKRGEPNAVFGLSLLNLEMQRIAKIVHAQPQYKKSKKRILLSLYPCSHTRIQLGKNDTEIMTAHEISPSDAEALGLSRKAHSLEGSLEVLLFDLHRKFGFNFDLPNLSMVYSIDRHMKMAALLTESKHSNPVFLFNDGSHRGRDLLSYLIYGDNELKTLRKYLTVETYTAGRPQGPQNDIYSAHYLSFTSSTEFCDAISQL